jgi:hypothetical protein
MGRPAAYPIRKILSFEEGMLAEVAAFRHATGAGTEAEAIRRLVALGLRRQAGTALETVLDAVVTETVEAWRLRHAPGLTNAEALEMLVRRGSQAVRPVAGPSSAPPTGAWPTQLPLPEPPDPGPPEPVAEAVEHRFDQETERRMERYRRGSVVDLDRQAVIGQLLAVFDDRMEDDVSFYWGETTPEKSRGEIIARLVKTALDDYFERDGKVKAR